MRWLVLVLAVLSLPARLWADEKDTEARARALAQEGLAAYDKKDYPAAIAAFEEAYALKNAPRLLFNIAQAHRLSGACAPALDYYRRYLAADPKSEISREVKRRIRQMEACTAREAQGAPPTPPPEPASRPTPSHAPAPPSPEPSPVAPGPPADEGSAGGQKKLAGIITGSAGVAVLGTGLWFGVRARHAADQVDARIREGGDWSQADRDLEARGRRDQTVAIALGVTGALAIGGGVFLYLWGSREDVAVAALPGGAALTWTGSF